MKSLDDLVAFLDRARESGVERYRLEVKHVAADEDVVLSRRVQTMMDKDGNVLDVLDDGRDPGDGRQDRSGIGTTSTAPGRGRRPTS